MFTEHMYTYIYKQCVLLEAQFHSYRQHGILDYS